MQLKYVSITGADDAVNVSQLNQLAQEFPFVEYAILFMPENEGKNRFPTRKWIRDFITQYKGRHTAMHLCGSALLRFIAGDGQILSTMAGFKRIQLNLKFGDIDGKYDPERLVAQVKANPQYQFIIQYTPDKAETLALFAGVENTAVLFDGSAGQGILPASWPAPLEGYFCGYAGGLSPDNIADNLQKIQASAGDAVTWIDMESGVRTMDRFDLNKARQVLKASKPYADQPAAAFGA